MTSYALELTTAVSPGEKITIDGDEYEVVNPDHLSETDEAKVAAKFALHSRLARQLDNSKTESEAESIAKKLRTSRIAIIAQLTTIPEETVEKLGLQGQASLLKLIQKALGLDDDEDI